MSNSLFVTPYPMSLLSYSKHLAVHCFTSKNRLDAVFQNPFVVSLDILPCCYPVVVFHLAICLGRVDFIGLWSVATLSDSKLSRDWKLFLIYHKVALQSSFSHFAKTPPRLFFVEFASSVRFCKVLVMWPKLITDWLISLSDVTRSFAIVYCKASWLVDSGRRNCLRGVLLGQITKDLGMDSLPLVY